MPAALDDPQIRVAPYLAVYDLRGSTAHESLVSAVPTPNQTQGLSDFGFGGHEEDFGIRADVGDDFAGLRADYYRLDMNSSRKGVLVDDWGALQQGDAVHMGATMDELRLSCLGEVFRDTYGEGDRAVMVRAAVGGQFTWRKLHLSAKEDSGLRQQGATAVERGALAPALRARADYRDFWLQGEYAISPDLSLGGDFDGARQDLEFRIGYDVPLQDVTLFAGWRRSWMTIDGTEGGLRHEADLVLQGFQFGVSIVL